MDLTLTLDTPVDDDGDYSWLEQTPAELGSITCAVANRRRLEALRRGDWYFVGVRVRADVTLDSGQTLTLYSPGVWGVESDSDDDYLWSIADDDMVEYLVEDLAELGFSRRKIAAAYAEVRPD